MYSVKTVVKILTFIFSYDLTMITLAFKQISILIKSF